MIMWDDIQRALPTLATVAGGTSTALRGLVALADGQKAFVKIATDEHSRHSIQAEIRVYRWLEQAGYAHVPHLVATSPNDDGLALPDLLAWDWAHVWNEPKLDAAFKALDELARLPGAQDFFVQSPYEGNPWRDLPADESAYASFLDDKSLQKVRQILADKDRRAEYTLIADSEPWRGTDLVHYDARADNFAYDAATGHGYFVDWNWAGLGSTAFDHTGLLVVVQLAGFDILPNYRYRIDRNSLVWLMGFWLQRGASQSRTGGEGRIRLQPLRVANALQAHELLVRLEVS
jgi:hypothetical protein